jgi:hypothetical protein
LEKADQFAAMWGRYRGVWERGLVVHIVGVAAGVNEPGMSVFASFGLSRTLRDY